MYWPSLVTDAYSDRPSSPASKTRPVRRLLRTLLTSTSRLIMLSIILWFLSFHTRSWLGCATGLYSSTIHVLQRWLPGSRSRNFDPFRYGQPQARQKLPAAAGISSRYSRHARMEYSRRRIALSLPIMESLILGYSS